MAHQNPRSIAALNRDDVRNGRRFIWWVPGEANSQKVGTFASEPFLDEHEELLVRYRLDTDPHQTRIIALSSMGITPGSSGEWGNALTIYEEGD